MKRCLCILLSFVLIGCSYISYQYFSVNADIILPEVQIENSERIELYVSQNNSYKLKYSFNVDDYTDEVKLWRSDNEKVAVVLSSGTVIPLAIGNATITLETINGLSDTIEVVVKSGSTINEGETVASNNIFGSSPIILHSFVPINSGIYEISLVDYDSTNQRVKYMIYEDGVRKPYKSSGGYISGLKCIQFELESGKVYHLGTSLVDPTGNVNHSFTVTKVTPSPSPEPTDVPETIKAGDKKEINVTTNSQVQKYMFIPDETGIYKYSSVGNKDVLGKIYNSAEELLAQSDNFSWYYNYYRCQGNFEIEHKFIAGEVYCLDSTLMSESFGNYYVSLEKLAVATDVNIENKDEIELKYAMEHQLKLNFTPNDARDSVVSWVSDNPEIITVSNGKLYGKTFGSANVTVTTETGLSDTITITVVDHEEIHDKEIKTSWSLDDAEYYKFVPTSDGIYELNAWSEHSSPTYPIDVEIYDNKFNSIQNVLDSKDKDIELLKENVYYIKVDSLSDDIGDITNFEISKVADLQEPTQSNVPTKTPIIEPTVTASISPTESPTICPTPESIETVKPKETEVATVPWEISGDVNIDGNINAVDALLVLKHAAKLDVIEEKSLEVADVTKDGKVDASDALAILKHAAGIN